MTRMLHVLIIVALVMTICATTVGCSKALSEQLAQDLIWKYVQTENTRLGRYSNYLGAIDIESVKIGKPFSYTWGGQEFTNYPVKAKLVYSGGYTREKEFSIWQDEYGEWQVQGTSL